MNRNDCDIIIEVIHSLELRECPAVLEQLANGSCAFNTDVVPGKAVQQNTGRGDRR
jgi:selenophosphate synthetase-related protein